MRIPNWAKIIWWSLLTGLLTYLLSYRYDDLLIGKSNVLDIFVFLIWIGLLLAPIFAEVDLFGVRFKKEIEELKSTLIQQILDLKAVLLNSINVTTSIYPQFNFASPPDSQLPEMEERFRRILHEYMSSQGIQTPEQFGNIVRVPDNVQFLFSVRYQLESELRRIWEQRFRQSNRRFVTINQIITALIHSELIDHGLAGIIREVYSMCSPAIHGGEVSENQVNFMRDIAPNLLATLRAL